MCWSPGSPSEGIRTQDLKNKMKTTRKEQMGTKFTPLTPVHPP